MGRPVFYLVIVVLFHTISECSGLEWEFGANLSGPKTIIEKEGIIPAYLTEKRIHLGKNKCTNIIYVKVEVEDMPTVTYNMDIAMVVLRYEKGRRDKNTVYRVTANAVKSGDEKCKSVKGPDALPYDSPDDKAPDNEASNAISPYDESPNDKSPYDSPNDASPYDASPYDASPYHVQSNDAFPNDKSPYDADPNDRSPYDAFPNVRSPYELSPNNASPNHAATDDAY